MDKKDNYESNEQIRDAMWKNAERGGDIFSEIKFRRNNKKNYFKAFVKVFSFILIAALSGGTAAQYVINKAISKNVNGNTNWSVLQNNVQGEYENPILQVTQKVAPTVVGISDKKEGEWETPEGSSSGIIVKSDGFIITNYHVIKDALQINVKLSNDNVLKAKVVGVDPITDLAVLKVEASNLPVAKFGDSSKVKIGDVAIAIGNPLGEQFLGTVTAGVISAIDRKINIVDKKAGEQTIYKVIQTDADINPGNNGGALCNIYGEVVGINNVKLKSTSEYYGMGYAINSNEVKLIINDLMTHGKVSRPSIGIYGEVAVPTDNDGIEGVRVQEVISGSGAAEAGIITNDIIVQMADVSLKNMEDLSNILNKHKVSDKVSCKIWRNGKALKISIMISELKELS
ncbi:S1C family serine protease [Clostridium lacusfryxellense]|uniref:S1C family serine protease n=1 Tax=Clostridium lacusfryxellense TaxID=205328 RepID=UPI001C0B7A67|nr:trypsin-like peptidase domain-containing protein [Clostridium lacusfryxellense]MBU3110638.1 trypsin-like peptidase domain-containing protein [Clostridium lacusfryxellense]